MSEPSRPSLPAVHTIFGLRSRKFVDLWGDIALSYQTSPGESHSTYGGQSLSGATFFRQVRATVDVAFGNR